MFRSAQRPSAKFPPRADVLPTLTHLKLPFKYLCLKVLKWAKMTANNQYLARIREDDANHLHQNVIKLDVSW